MPRTLTIRGVSEHTLRALRSQAAANRRSLNSELNVVLEHAAALTQPAVREPAAPRYAANTPRRSRGALADAVDRDAIARLCKRHHIRFLALFGSQARGDAGSDSDVDVLVEFEPGKTPGLAIEAVADALRPAFGGRRVDLVTRRGLSPRLKQEILRTAVTLHGA